MIHSPYGIGPYRILLFVSSASATVLSAWTTAIIYLPEAVSPSEKQQLNVISLLPPLLSFPVSSFNILKLPLGFCDIKILNCIKDLFYNNINRGT